MDNDSIKEKIKEELEEEGLTGKELDKAIEKRFLQETSVKPKRTKSPQKNIKVRQKTIKRITAKKGGKIGDKLVGKMYGGQVMKKAGGGMSYQLYGGTNKNIRDGNKEVSQFYKE